MSLIPDTAKYDLNLQLRACQSSSRRNGKVARLPAYLRDQINRMLDDGLPYKTIIQQLGPAGQGLNEDNLSNWRLGGYQDYLKAQALNERARGQIEAAADVVRESGAISTVQLQQACGQIALLQYLETIIEYGDEVARESLKQNPAKFITLINACCNLANSSIALDEQRLRAKIPDPQGSAPNPQALPEPVRT